MSVFLRGISFAQLSGQVPNTSQQKDTTQYKTNDAKWKNLNTGVSYKKLNSERVQYPDSSLHTFHRNLFLQPWKMDLGNTGSPVQNLFFTPEDHSGPGLGYHAFDIYRYNTDSLDYYSNTRPYSVFSYQLGSQQEQVTHALLSENLKPNLNFTLEYRKINSPGYFKLQKNNHDNACFSLHYKGLNQRYELFCAMVYNKQVMDENGGVDSVHQLDNINYTDRKTLQVAFQNPAYSTTRSSVTNTQQDFSMMLQHSYAWGKADTIYSSDSTSYMYKYIPRFSISHKFEFGTEKHIFNDIRPDSARYGWLFAHSFTSGNLTDSVFSQQRWFWNNNNLMLNGFIGKPDELLKFSVGAGIRMDQFNTDTSANLATANERYFISNYLAATLRKEALEQGQWFYDADARLFLTGDASGNLTARIALGKELKNNWGSLSAGFRQQLNNAPYAYTIYQNQYFGFSNSFEKEKVTQLYFSAQSPKLHFSFGVSNYIINNYIYLNSSQKPDQYKNTFGVTQFWFQKLFKIGFLYFDNEVAIQPFTENLPINIPAVCGKHQLSIERGMFKNALKIAVGLELRYYSSYFAPAYSAFFNRFYYQDSYYLSNIPEAAAFFNFKIKRFRAFLMADQLQQLFVRNNINFQGYPAQDMTIRFGFSWVMIN